RFIGARTDQGFSISVISHGGSPKASTHDSTDTDNHLIHCHSVPVVCPKPDTRYRIAWITRAHDKEARTRLPANGAGFFMPQPHTPPARTTGSQPGHHTGASPR